MGSVLGKITEELPRHEVLRRAAAYEIRRYHPCVVAETTYESRKGMFGGDQGGPFMRLARFIGVTAKPQNESAEPIAMTAPVLMSGGTNDDAHDGSTYTMAFFLPASRFRTAAEAPKPISTEVRLRDIPERTVAALTFSGAMRADLIAEKDGELREALERDGVRVAPGARAMAAGYNPPWTPSFLRTNEILLEVVHPT